MAQPRPSTLATICWSVPNIGTIFIPTSCARNRSIKWSSSVSAPPYGDGNPATHTSWPMEETLDHQPAKSQSLPGAVSGAIDCAPPGLRVSISRQWLASQSQFADLRRALGCPRTSTHSRELLLELDVEELLLLDERLLELDELVGHRFLLRATFYARAECPGPEHGRTSLPCA